MLDDATGTGDALREMYRDVVLDHARSPRHRGRLRAPTHRGRGANRFCGDEVGLELRLEDGHLAEIAVDGRGCTVSQAAASLMAETIAGLPLDEVDEVLAAYQRMMTGDGEVDPRLGDAEVLRHVRRFPARVRCALLAWSTLRSALDGRPRVDDDGARV